MILHFLLGVFGTAHASSFYIKPFSEFTQEASVIARGTISNIHAENAISSSGAKIIYTYANLDVKEVFKGPIRPQTILIRKIGGTKDGFAIDIPGSPEFTEGEDTVLFLGDEKKEDQSYEVTGLELGKYSVEEKDGKPTLSGGIFNYSKRGEHNAADAQPENQKPWTLSDLRALIEKQGGKDAPAKASSTPAPAGPTANSGTTPANASATTPISATENTSASAESEKSSSSAPSYLLYGALLLAALGAWFFLFRKR